MKQTDIVFEKYASFWDKHKNTLLAGGIGALLSGGIGAAAAGVDPEDTPSQKLWKRLKTGLVAGTLGGLATGGTAHLLKSTGADKAISKGVNKVVDTVKGKSDNSNGGKPGQKAKEDKGLISELTDSAGEGTALGAAGGGIGGTVLGARLGGKAKSRTSKDHEKNIKALEDTRKNVRQTNARIAGERSFINNENKAIDSIFGMTPEAIKRSGSKDAVLHNHIWRIENGFDPLTGKAVTTPELDRASLRANNALNSIKRLKSEISTINALADMYGPSYAVDPSRLSTLQKRIDVLDAANKAQVRAAYDKFKSDNKQKAQAAQDDYTQRRSAIDAAGKRLELLKLNPHGQKVLDTIDSKLADERAGKLKAEMRGGNNTRPVRNRIFGGLLGLTGGAGIGTAGGAIVDRAIVKGYNERKNKNN